MQQKHSPVVELTSEELSAFIIPPPPATAAGGHQGGVQRGGGGDREVLELRVAAHQKQAPDNALSPKIASLQERLAQLSSRYSNRKSKLLYLKANNCSVLNDINFAALRLKGVPERRCL